MLDDPVIGPGWQVHALSTLVIFRVPNLPKLIYRKITEWRSLFFYKLFFSFSYESLKDRIHLILAMLSRHHEFKIAVVSQALLLKLKEYHERNGTLPRNFPWKVIDDLVQKENFSGEESYNMMNRPFLEQHGTRSQENIPELVSLNEPIEKSKTEELMVQLLDTIPPGGQPIEKNMKKSIEKFVKVQAINCYDAFNVLVRFMALTGKLTGIMRELKRLFINKSHVERVERYQHFDATTKAMLNALIKQIMGKEKISSAYEEKHSLFFTAFLCQLSKMMDGDESPCDSLKQIFDSLTSTLFETPQIMDLNDVERTSKIIYK